MNRRYALLTGFGAAAAVAAVLAVVAAMAVPWPAIAQAAVPPGPPAAAAAPPAPETDPGGATYAYEIRGRRDPFRSLLIRKQTERTGLTGIAGMLVDELELQGTVRTRQGWIAMMRGADNRSYLVKRGTTIFDGEVTEIGASQVTFRQNVNDPTSPKPFRDVVKSLSLQQKQ